MKIQAIKWLSRDAEEASILVSDGKYSCWCFCHPCSAQIGDIVSELYTLDAKRCMAAPGTAPYITKHSVGDGHDLCGHLFNKENSIISIGDILVEIDADVPGDIVEGDIVEFSCGRIDAWIERKSD
ncbi:hypothetical protein [Pseudodesulfovibrio sp. zrk46]|uniref:hypothetical protein n=1 Tax=Pseudodesulfovibrio sp. zrk46 TaxID=2725288 RepID=UPI00144921CF|nr:hypothetical protein [Pseudodesulfovibrio sp. zrk46]QJB56848.1 hypothetical protein HFN16_10725 [Pseudodesulfovibrio sp. zrk46]